MGPYRTALAAVGAGGIWGIRSFGVGVSRTQDAQRWAGAPWGGVSGRALKSQSDPNGIKLSPIPSLSMSCMYLGIVK